MINASADFYQEMANGNRNFILNADITPRTGSVLKLTNADIWQGGFEIEDSVSSDSDFQVGAAIINKLTLTLNNMDGRFTDYEFEYATVVAKVGLTVNGVNKMINKGTFIVNEATFDDTLITLECYDKMCYFEQPYSKSNLNYENGVTLQRIVLDACSGDNCGVPLAGSSQNFPNYDVIVYNRPDSETTTFRQVISWVAQMAGCFARVNVNGNLELKRFNVASLVKLNDEGYDGGYFDSSSPYSSGDTLNGGTFNPWNTGSVADGGTFLEFYNSNYPIDYIQEVFSHKTSIVPIQFTGVTINVRSEGQTPIEPFPVGTSDYALTISDNPFIDANNVATVANSLYLYVTALQFWKANVSHLSNPLMEAGDVAVFWDRKGNKFPILVTKTTFTSSEAQLTVSAAADPVRKKYQGLTDASKTYVEMQKMAFEEKSARQIMYEALTAAINAKQGLYITKEEVPGGGSVFYLHDQATLEQSKNVWMITAQTFSVTSAYNGEHPEQTVWSTGFDVYGDMFTGVLSVIGIDFDWARGGAISISKNGTETFYADVDTGVVRINADSISIGGSSVEDVATNAAKSATNLLLSPDDLTNWTYWRSNGQGVGTDSNGVVPGQTDPNGGTNAFKVTKGSDGTNTVLRVSQANNPVKYAGQNYRLSIWMKASSNGTVNIYFNGTDPANTKTVSLTTSWQLYMFEIKADAITNLSDYYLCIGGANSWTPTTIYFFAPIVEYADSQEVVFNQLTNNGADQCIKLQNGQLYINASYIKSGTLTLGGANNVNGSLSVFNASGSQIGKWDKDGVEILDGTIKTKVLQTVSYEPGRYTQIKNGIFEIGYTDYNGAETLAGQFRSDRQNAVDSQGNSVIYYCLKLLASQGKHLLLSCESLARTVELKPVGDYSIIGTSDSINDFCVVGGGTTIRGRLAVDGRFTVNCPASSSADIVLSTRAQETGTPYTFSILPNQSYYKFLFSHMVKMEGDLWVHGNLQVDGSYPSSSDERLKDIEVWSVPNDFLSEVEPIQFKWNDDRDDDKIHYGFGAQSVKELLGKHGMEDSGIVYYDESQDRYYINYLEFIPILTDKVQRLEAENSYLKDQISSLEKRLSRLEAMLDSKGKE